MFEFLGGMGNLGYVVYPFTIADESQIEVEGFEDSEGCIQELIQKGYLMAANHYILVMPEDD